MELVAQAFAPLALMDIITSSEEQKTELDSEYEKMLSIHKSLADSLLIKTTIKNNIKK